MRSPFRENIPSRFPGDLSLEDKLGLWWILHVRPNCEWKIARYLLRHDICYYFPLYNRKTRVGYLRRERITLAPLFRGYICFALHREKHSLLYDSRDFTRIIQIKNQEKFVRELEFVARAIKTEKDLLLKPGILKGRKVIVTSGQLQGVEGIIIGQSKKGRFAITVEMFNRTVIVNVDSLTDLELL